MADPDAKDNLNDRLSRLMAEASAFPPKSCDRQQRLTQVIQLVQRSGRLWSDRTCHYEEALQKTWTFICHNPEAYDPTRAGVITWINNLLKFRLKDEQRLQSKQRQRNFTPPEGDGLETLGENFIDQLPAPQPVPPLLEEIWEWIQTDPDGLLRQAHLKSRPEVNCQVLLLRRLPPDIVPWEAIVQEFGLKAVSTASALYCRKCLPLLRQFGEQQGYLDP